LAKKCYKIVFLKINRMYIGLFPVVWHPASD